MTARIRQECLTCQACDPPSLPQKRPIAFTVVPDKFMASVSLVIFSMPAVEYHEVQFDCFLLMVDRLTGWMIARPSQKLGVTGEKAARLLRDNSWGEVGVPYIVTSDQGSQFISQFWTTLCARLGVRCAMSQAHRPQANGRAEVCGRIILNALRKMHTDHGVNWVEAPPRALRIHHDMVNEDGCSPYMSVFGRERNLAGIPYLPPRVCPSAADFCEISEQNDRLLAQNRNTGRYNSR